MNDELVFGLCAGIDKLPKEVTEYIFPKEYFDNVANRFDYNKMYGQIVKVLGNVLKDHNCIRVYVTTGYPQALIAVNQFCMDNIIELLLMHYNEDTGEYEEQLATSAVWINQMREEGFIS